jgi:molecular chaperone HtpG
MKIKLGKDLIECLSWSLYENPLVLFREAIQNSIDAFQETNEIWSKLCVDIKLNQQERSISIQDNGPGLNSQEFTEVLGSMGESKKKDKDLAGCRGIGRLSGLGICDEIIFSSHSESCLTTEICRINAKGIRDGLNKSSKETELSEFLSKYVQFSSEKTEVPGKTFFNIKFVNVKRLASDLLLNPLSISTYVSNIAPIQIEKTFDEFSCVENFYKKFNLPYGLKIKINGDIPLAKKFDDKKFLVNNKSLEYEEHILKNENGETLGAIWLLHHEYLGALSASSFRGLRFRHKNILIGNEDSFSGFFKEPRFNRWTIGEAHPISSKIRPSVKRDDFEPNEDFNKFAYKIRPLLYSVAQRARKSSALRIETKYKNQKDVLKPIILKIRKSVPKKIGSTLTRKKFLSYIEDVITKSNGKPTPETFLSCL